MQRSPQGTLTVSPQDLIVYAQSPFASWMDRRQLEPDLPSEDSNAINDLDQALIKLGRDHEQRFLNQLIDQQVDLVIIDNRGAFDATKTAMMNGHDYIFQGALRRDNCLGYPDFLVKIPYPSQLGDWSYQPLECKLALSPKSSFILQACFYCDLLQDIQGYRPQQFQVLLGNLECQSYETEQYIHYFDYLKQAFLESLDSFDPKQSPRLSIAVDHGRWSDYVQDQLIQQDHLSQVANITRRQIQRLEKAGIQTLAELAMTENAEVPKLNRQTVQKLQQQARVQRSAREGDAPTYEVLPPDPSNPRRGLALLPPPSPYDLYFDIEGYPLISEGLEYLWGIVHYQSNQLRFKDWWAHDQAEEKVAFESFIDWVYDRWQSHPELHIYHYAPYETTALKKLMGKHATRAEQVDQLLRNHVFIDLYQIVRQSLVVGADSYSIKRLEPLYGRSRSESVKTAMDSITEYFQWLQIKDDDPQKAQTVLDNIRDYNEVDCISTQELTDWLRSLQADHNIPYLASDRENDNPIETAIELTENAQLAQDILSGEPDPVGSLLAQLLEFHAREAKPFWWQRFEWKAMDAQELLEQPSAIAQLQRTSTPPQPPEGRSRSWLFEYKFPVQDIKFSAPASCCFVPDAAVSNCSLKSLDLAQGILTLSISTNAMKKGTGTDYWEPPLVTSLIDMSNVSAKALAQSILETVQSWQQMQELQPALRTLLQRESPRFKAGHAGLSGQSRVEDAIAAVQNLDQSLLCIQGPPGTGKTFTAAQMIEVLLLSGKRVVISANSHAAIANLMKRVASSLADISILKLGGNEDEAYSELRIVWKKSDRGLNYEDYQLAGATAFQLCKPAAQGQWDYLFVDEAGQMSLANLMAIARCSDNIVLMGDQMQLEQPIQADHPGESGQSALGYFLQGQSTIPADKGIFLATTYRMHPQICQFISTAVYDGRLQHHPHTMHHQIKLPLPHDYLQKGAGIQFIPVNHQDNSQSSSEEVVIIEGIVKSLLGLDFVSDRGETEGIITADEILVVAPYNLQVKKLQETLGDRAKVGTVDKFQGQEAPVVIVSMTASSAEDAPRGLDFLLNLNRINVAISRAQCLSIVVGSPNLVSTIQPNIEAMKQMNLFCKLMAQS